MSSPAKHSRGISTSVPHSALWEFGGIDPTRYHVYFNDFNTYTAGDWTVTEAGSGSRALTDIDGGALLITNAGSDNDHNELQKVGEGYLLAAGYKAWFKARFKVSDATQSDFVIGLCVTDTSLQGSVNGAGVTDGIFFNKDDGDAYLDVQCQKDASSGQTRAAAIATVVDDTFLTVGWYYDGVSEVKYFVNDVHIGTLDGSSSYLPDTELTVSFALQNGEGSAKNMTLDYIFAAKER
jgi:hypothetical protein